MPNTAAFSSNAAFKAPCLRTVLLAAISVTLFTPLIAKAQSANRSGALSPNYCGTVMIEDLARRIGGRVGTTSGNGTTDFVAPEIPVGESLSVRCGDAPTTYGSYPSHNWAPAFLNAFLAITERTVGRPQLELVQAMA